MWCFRVYDVYKCSNDHVECTVAEYIRPVEKLSPLKVACVGNHWHTMIFLRKAFEFCFWVTFSDGTTLNDITLVISLNSVPLISSKQSRETTPVDWNRPTAPESTGALLGSSLKKKILILASNSEPGLSILVYSNWLTNTNVFFRNCTLEFYYINISCHWLSASWDDLVYA